MHVRVNKTREHQSASTIVDSLRFTVGNVRFEARDPAVLDSDIEVFGAIATRAHDAHVLQNKIHV